MEIEQQWWMIAVGGLLTGGVARDLLRRVWPSRSERRSAEDSLRDDLMQELGALRARVDALDKDLAEWKSKYYSLLEDYTRLRAEVETLRVQVNGKGGE